MAGGKLGWERKILRLKTDLHVHTWHSDGGCPPRRLFPLAKTAGLSCLAVTDHDQISDPDELLPLARVSGVRLLRGVELSTYDNRRNRRVHILGYFPERESRPGLLNPVREICAKTCEIRREAGLRMAEQVAARYPITRLEVEEQAAHSNSIFKQHIMLALMQAGFASAMYGPLWRELFDSQCGSCLVNVASPDVWEVLPVLRGTGAVIVLAHPYTYRSLELMEELTDADLLDGVEVWQSKTTPEQEAALLEFAGERGLIPTGGSDYHGMTGLRPAPLGAGLTPDASLARIDALLQERN